MKSTVLPWLLVAGLIIRLILSVPIYSGDVNNHISWGRDILHFGSQGVYEREFTFRYGTLVPTYPPIPLFLFTASQAMYNWTYEISLWANSQITFFPSRFVWFLQKQNTLPAFYKVWAILADIGLAYSVYLFTRKSWLSALVLFNPAFFYNSAIWGQIESIPIFFLLVSLYFIVRIRRPFLSTIFMVLALLTKQSAIIFIPLFGLVFLAHFKWTTVLKSVGLALLFFWLSFLPFFQAGSLLVFPFVTYWDKIQTGSGSTYVVDHAFNFWALVTGIGKISDSQSAWADLSYNSWGLLFFTAAMIFILVKFKSTKIFAAAALSNMSAFFFLTRMHERYLAPALVFLLLWASSRRVLLPVFVFLSLFHFLNLYHNWWAPRIPLLVTWLSFFMTINALIWFALGTLVWLLWKYAKS